MVSSSTTRHAFYAIGLYIKRVYMCVACNHYFSLKSSLELAANAVMNWPDCCNLPYAFSLTTRPSYNFF